MKIRYQILEEKPQEAAIIDLYDERYCEPTRLPKNTWEDTIEVDLFDQSVHLPSTTTFNDTTYPITTILFDGIRYDHCIQPQETIHIYLPESIDHFHAYCVFGDEDYFMTIHFQAKGEKRFKRIEEHAFRYLDIEEMVLDDGWCIDEHAFQDCCIQRFLSGKDAQIFDFFEDCFIQHMEIQRGSHLNAGGLYLEGEVQELFIDDSVKFDINKMLSSIKYKPPMVGCIPVGEGLYKDQNSCLNAFLTRFFHGGKNKDRLEWNLKEGFSPRIQQLIEEEELEIFCCMVPILLASSMHGYLDECREGSGICLLSEIGFGKESGICTNEKIPQLIIGNLQGSLHDCFMHCEIGILDITSIQDQTNMHELALAFIDSSIETLLYAEDWQLEAIKEHCPELIEHCQRCVKIEE